MQSKVLSTASGVNIAISILTIRSICTKSAFDCLRFGKFPPYMCESWGVTYRHSYQSFSALQIIVYSSSRCWKRHPNWSITGDAILPQIAAKLTKKHGSELGVLLWRRLTPHAEKTRNMGAQLQSLRCTTATKLSWKIYLLYDFWCRLVRSEPFRRKIQTDWNSWKCERLHNSDDKNMEMWLAMLKAVRCASLQKFRITCNNVGLINLFGGVWIMKVPSISVNLLELIL